MHGNWKTFAEALKEAGRKQKENEIRLDERMKTEKKRTEKSARLASRAESEVLQEIEKLASQIPRTKRDRRLRESTRRVRLNFQRTRLNELYLELARRLIEMRDPWIIAYIRSTNVTSYPCGSRLP